MEMLGREPKPGQFNPLLAATLLAWAGAIWLVVGTVGVIYLLADSGGERLFFGAGAQGRVYTVLTLWPGMATFTVWSWLLAAFLWWRAADS